MDDLREQLAPGAPPGAGSIPLCVPALHGAEWTYVKEALDTNWVSSVGPFVDRFEQQVAAYVGARHAVATASGTAALHVALVLAGVEPGDEVVVPALSFVAPANAVRYVGAEPVFVGVDRDYWQIAPEILEEFLDRQCERGPDGSVRNRTTGRRVRAVLPVHALGHPAPIGAVVALARAFGLAVVEDAAEALGARYRAGGGEWRHVGHDGDVGCLSFNGNKLITSGGGGMIVTGDEATARRARYLTTQAKDDPVAYVHGEVGFNYRLGNVQAAIGCAQLEAIAAHLEAKRRIAATYGQALGGLDGIATMPEAPWAEAAFWMYTILVDPARARVDRDRLLAALERDGIQSRPLWQALHESPAHRGAFAFRCEEAARLSAHGLSLPCSVGLTREEQERVIAALRGELE